MLSIRFSLSHFYQYNAQNQEILLQTTRWGEPIAVFKDAPIYVALDTVKSVDVVDEGALTETMFTENKEEQGLFSRFINFITGKSMKNPDEIIDGPLHANGGGTNDGAIIWVGDRQFKAADVTTMLAEITALKAEKEETRTKSELLTFKLAAAEAKVVVLEAEKVVILKVPAAALTNGATGGGAPQAKVLDPEMAAFAKGLRAKAGV